MGKQPWKRMSENGAGIRCSIEKLQYKTALKNDIKKGLKNDIEKPC
jgi:hypothetical protein